MAQHPDTTAELTAELTLCHYRHRAPTSQPTGIATTIAALRPHPAEEATALPRRSGRIAAMRRLHRRGVESATRLDVRSY